MAAMNPDCVKVARQARGLNQAQLADAAGVSQGLVSRLENGLFEPNEETLGKIATALRFPVSFFRLPDRVLGLPVSMQYRKKASVGQRAIEQLEAEVNLRLMHLRRLLAAVDYQPELPFPRLEIEEFGGDPAAVAEMVRRVWQLPSGPIRDLVGVAERAGVIVFLCDFQVSGVDGLTLQPTGLPVCIFLNAAMPGDRQRFTLAHELGHAVMHPVPTPDMESQADRFAAALLMPARDIAPQLSGGITLPRLAALKPVWRVSMGALLMRAKTLGVVNESQSSYLWRQFSRLGYRTAEPPEVAVAAEAPHVVSDVLNVHLSELGYTLSELAASLHVYEPDLMVMHHLQAPCARPALRVVR